MKTIPEGCKLVAVLDGSGSSATWTLCVEDREGEVVAYLRWPPTWPETATRKKLTDSGFECVIA